MNGDNPLATTDEFQLMDLERQLHVKNLQIESLLEVTKAINNNLSYASLFKIYEFILRAQLGVEQFALYIKKDDNWERSILFGYQENEVEEVNVEEELTQFRKPTNIEDSNLKTASQYKIVVPVQHKSIPLAYILLGDISLYDNEKIEQKLKFIQTITNVIVVAIENKRLFNQQIENEKLQKELELAANMQALLIPDMLPDNDFIVMNGIYKPHRTIGGDYYDYIKINEDEFMFCIADISGKGAAAAILMANFQAVLKTLVSEKHGMIPLVYKLNQRVLEITKGEKFITLFLAFYNIRTKTLRYVNAGHNPSIVIHEDHVETLDKGCTILGMFEELPGISFGEVKIKPNSLIINYTDGLTDTQNDTNELFEIEHLIAFGKKNINAHPKDFNRDLLLKLENFKGNQEYVDDISLLSCRLF